MPLHIPTLGERVTEADIWAYVARTMTDPDSYKADVSPLDTPANFMADVSALLTLAQFNIAEFETEWSTDPNVNSVASAAEANLTEGDMGTIVYPTGAVEVSVMLLPIIKAVNQSGATHHIGITVQYSEDDGGWADIIDLTTDPPMGLVVLDGAGDSWAMPLDVSAIVETGKKYEFRFQVDSDDDGEVHYTTSFVLVLIYKMG